MTIREFCMSQKEVIVLRILEIRRFVNYMNFNKSMLL